MLTKLTFTGLLFPFLTLYIRVGDTKLLLLAIASTLVGIVTRQSATKAGTLYLANVLGMFTAIHTVAAR